MSDTRNLETLAEEVVREARTLTSFLQANSYYIPSFSAPWKEYPELPDPVQESRRKLREAARAVHDLALGPVEHAKDLARRYIDVSTLHWLIHFRIPDAIPLHGSIPYPQVARTCDVDEHRLRRILRYCMTNRLFAEPEPDNVAHTAFSTVLVTDPLARVAVDFRCEESFPAAAKLVDAHEKWEESDEGNQTAYNLAHHTNLPIDQSFAQPGNEDRAKRYGNLLTSFHQTPEYDLKHTVHGYDWGKVEGGVVVDIGGNTGQTAIALAKAYLHLRILVEDLPHVVAEGEKNLPPGLKDRIRFLAHDFFTPQPEVVLRAQTYLLRHVLHQHGDTPAAQILANLMPGLRRDAELVMMDAVVMPPPPPPAPGTVVGGCWSDETAEKRLRAMDLEMMQGWNGAERTMQDWRRLLARVSPELAVRRAVTPVGSALSIMEIELED